MHKLRELRRLLGNLHVFDGDNDTWFSLVSAERVISAEGGNALVGDGRAIDSALASASQVGSKAPVDGLRSFSSGLHDDDGTAHHRPPDNVPAELLQQQMAMEEVGRNSLEGMPNTLGEFEPCWFCSKSSR